MISEDTPKFPRKAKRTTKYKNADAESTSRLVTLIPKNDRQGDYIRAINNNQQVIVLGPSGTGKTYIAATAAANAYAVRSIDKIIITRPNVSVGKDLGYLPGTLEEKYAPWVLPVFEVLEQQLGKGVVETGVKNGNIEMAPLSTMRGRSFSNAFVIVDEAQNLTIHEVKMLLTRIGENCKIIVNGDLRQSDIKEQSGLSKIMHLAKKYNMDIPVVEFTVDDIVRSAICKAWVVAFLEEGL
jgi:phosphate starvation-inducible protein PhoH and related proteins